MAKTFGGGFITVSRTGVTTTTSGTSAGGTLPNGNGGGVPPFVRIVATAAAYVRIGVGAQTAVATDLLIQPGDGVIISTNNATHYAAIQVSAAGVVQISPLENA